MSIDERTCVGLHHLLELIVAVEPNGVLLSSIERTLEQVPLHRVELHLCEFSQTRERHGALLLIAALELGDACFEIFGPDAEAKRHTHPLVFIELGTGLSLALVELGADPRSAKLIGDLPAFFQHPCVFFFALSEKW